MAVNSPHIAGFFLIPMSEALGIGRGTFSLVYSIRTFTEGVAGPVVGRLLDRYGPRMLMVGGAVIAGLALMALGVVQNFWQFAVVLGIFGLASAACMGRLVAGVTVSRWFVRKRGRAIALITTGMSLGIAIFSPLSQGFIDLVGWRWTWTILGACVWVLIIPVSLAFMRKSPEVMGLRPDGDPVDDNNSGSGQGIHSGDREEIAWTLLMARRTRTFWFLTASMVLGTGATTAVSFHQVPAILDKGFSPAAAASAMVVFGLLGIASKIIIGFLAERLSIQLLVVSTTIGSAISVIILMNANSVGMVFSYAVLAGFMRPATHPLSTMVWADYFGRKSLGSIQGMIQPFLLLARAGGPLLGGLLFDWTGRYIVAFWVIIGLHLLAALAMVFAPPPKPPVGAGQQVGAAVDGLPLNKSGETHPGLP
jgi:sugar phosphate permease